MAAEEGLTVCFTSEARSDLEQILLWSAGSFGLKVAQGYVDFISEEIINLAFGQASPRTVPSRPDLRYKIIRRRSSGHGHVVVFRIASGQVLILHVFHTAQDWVNQL